MAKSTSSVTGDFCNKICQKATSTERVIQKKKPPEGGSSIHWPIIGIRYFKET